MLTCSLAPTAPIPALFGILLLAASLNAQNKSWDNPVCTSGTLSVPRGSRAVMSCGISNLFKDVTVWLIAHGEERTIFNKTRQGRFSRSGWELWVQGGQAQLVIEDTQDVHAGLYLWGLHGRQRYYSNVTLSVSEPSREDEVTDVRVSEASTEGPAMSSQLEARPKTLVGIVITAILILGLAGISALVCYRHHRSWEPSWMRRF
ncbi:secreted and transmembrane protein 1 [Meriones unguiculatus]|uniref:secreted and transmembrane protein 1 n=1 Tax=Meriones unguiculatus TaxID=10047 RepID=UPI000B4F607A|nr:secreted and transmembrane protein 1 [Meriones unguiculatus]